MDGILPEVSLTTAVDLLVRLIEFAGAIVVFLGAALAFWRFMTYGLWQRSEEAFVPIRLGLGRYLALGLEFQLAGDILRTAVAPTFSEIGQLAAIAAIRTVLNYFLRREITEEREELAAEKRRGEAPHVTPPAGQEGRA